MMENQTTITDIQDAFIHTLVAQRTQVWVFLINGVRLTGVIDSADKYVVAVRSPTTGLQTVYKHAISTISEPHEMPMRKSTERAPRRAPAVSGDRSLRAQTIR
jgi:host factor-I protein